MESHPNSPTGRPKSWRYHITLPGILAQTVGTRIDELQRETFSQHGLETVCFDLRIRRHHAVTGQFATEASEIQDAIDRFITAHYRPGAERDGGTLRKVIFGTLPPFDPKTGRIAPRSDEQRDIFFPPRFSQRICERLEELGFANLSQYLCSVMRYDLLLGGKHLYFGPSDCTPEMLAALDEETLTEFLKNKKPKIMLDHLLEEAAGKELTREECEILLRQVGRKIRALAVEHYL